MTYLNRMNMFCIRTVLATAVAVAISSAVYAAPFVRQSNERDQTEIAVTAYNSGIALIRDVRRVNVPEGLVVRDSRTELRVRSDESGSAAR